MIHASDCAVNNLPALPAGSCDCGLELALDAARHGSVAALVAWTGSHGFLIAEVCREALIEPHRLPADGLVVEASATHLPNPHEPKSLSGAAHGVNFDDAGIPIISKF